MRPITLDFIVMPRSCSPSVLSIYRNFPDWREETIPLVANKASAIVVLPVIKKPK
ncbi:unnamed protein product [Schistosoma curassoni]|uniref:Uncharacterized protein n=1 Tax=Schistosoma curassoni TaxID=6186 RepID=A0A183KRW0_9TREM|nr:unnamed protein product [Schistosoma curassoni]